jgi:hypothetical protein
MFMGKIARAYAASFVAKQRLCRTEYCGDLLRQQVCDALVPGRILCVHDRTITEGL